VPKKKIKMKLKERERNGNNQEEIRTGRRLIEEDKEVNIPTRE
jgi:hypothetical protein